jgi:23S rRNA pseudouridine1911/1915/1917 synthase
METPQAPQEPQTRQTPEASDLTRLVIFPEQAGERIDRAIPALSTLSRRRVRGLLTDGFVWINGKPLRVQSRPVQIGDVVDVLLPPDEVGTPRRPDLPEVEILHQDDRLLAVNKPAGILSQPAETREPGELAMDERVLLHQALAQGKRPFLRLMHRLDRVTSGVLLFANHPEATAPLAKAWREGRAERLYLAVVEGDPDFEERKVEAPIGRDPQGGWHFMVLAEEAGGRPARTEVRVRDRRGKTALVECRLVTGRTHQVRVHLAHLGYPVVGDTQYGAAPETAPRPLLHAAELRVPHPRSGKLVRVRAPLPEEFG